MNIISGILGVAFIVLWGWAGFLCAKRKGRDTGYWAIACVFITVILFVIELSSPLGEKTENNHGISFVECAALTILCACIAAPLFACGVYIAQQFPLS